MNSFENETISSKFKIVFETGNSYNLDFKKQAIAWFSMNLVVKDYFPMVISRRSFS